GLQEGCSLFARSTFQGFAFPGSQGRRGFAASRDNSTASRATAAAAGRLFTCDGYTEHLGARIAELLQLVGVQVLQEDLIGQFDGALLYKLQLLESAAINNAQILRSLQRSADAAGNHLGSR